MRYVRIEFPGYEVATGSEVNGLTFCSVGDGTRIEYIQISYSGDDGFEWFGGTVNAKHIISYKTEDDDFDTDNGFSGLVQFGLISRDPQISDTDTGNAFESDNDASGSVNQPFTKGVFSNISAFGPYASKSLVLAAQHEDGSAMRLRRSTRLQIFNSLFAGWGNGIRMESDNTMNAAKEGILNMKNCIIAGDKNKDYRVSGTVFDVIALQNWYLTPAYKNKMLTSNADALITGPFNYAGPNFQPASGSPVFNASGWVTTTAEEFSRYPQITDFSGYPNPFSKTTTIQVTVAETSGASLVVCNLSGMPVARLHSGLLYPGSYRFPFDATNLPGGIYLARFTGNGPGKTLKLMVK